MPLFQGKGTIRMPLFQEKNGVKMPLFQEFGAARGGDNMVLFREGSYSEKSSTFRLTINDEVCILFGELFANC